MTKRIVFTEAAVSKLAPPEKGQAWYYDLKTQGLAVCVQRTGSRSFYLYRRIDGRPEKILLGRCSDLTVDAARKKAAKLGGEIASGENPAKEKAKRKTELTLGALWELWQEHRAIHKKASSNKADTVLWTRFLSPWGARKLSSIEHADVQKLHSTIGRENGKFLANRMLSLASALFTMAADHGEFSKQNPCRGIKAFAEKSRDRFIQPDEIPRLLAALEEEPNQQAADAFRLMLFCGARKGNVLAMRWDEIDLNSGTWRIPDTKANEPQRVHLAAAALDVLKRRFKSRKESPFVFPSMRAGGAVPHMTDPIAPWRAVCKRADLLGLRMHDLRRSLGSWAAATGASLLVIGKALGHRDSKSTSVYARLNIDPVRVAVDAAVDAMMTAGRQQTATEATDDDEPEGIS